MAEHVAEPPPADRSTRPDAKRRPCLVSIVESRPAEIMVNCVILANCLTMAWDAPVGIPPEERVLILRLDFAFLWVYTIESALRIVGYGPQHFFRDRWLVRAARGSFAALWRPKCPRCQIPVRMHARAQTFELLIVLISWLPIFLAVPEQAAWIARSMRSLRVLLLFDSVPGMKALVASALWAIPSLGSVSGVCFFIIGALALRSQFQRSPVAAITLLPCLSSASRRRDGGRGRPILHGQLALPLRGAGDLEASGRARGRRCECSHNGWDVASSFRHWRLLWAGARRRLVRWRSDLLPFRAESRALAVV